MSKRGNYDPAFKAREALEALKSDRTVSELSGAYDVHPTMIHQWKKALLEGAADIFERGGKRTALNMMRRRSKNCTPRSGSWSSPTIFWKESSNPGPVSEAWDD